MVLVATYAGEILKCSKTSALTFNSKKYSVLKIVLIMRIYMSFSPKVFPNVCVLIHLPIVLPLCYHFRIKTWNAKELGRLSLKGKKK